MNEPRDPTVQRPWFRAKARGWGWDLPTTWQGWAVMFAYAGAMFGLAQVVPWVPGFVAVAVVLTAGLVGVCWWKGEKPGRRRGPGRG